MAPPSGVAAEHSSEFAGLAEAGCKPEKERVRIKATMSFTRTMRCEHEPNTASAVVWAPTSGASRRRAGPRSADRREHAGPCCDVQRRGIKSSRHAGSARRCWRRVS